MFSDLPEPARVLSQGLSVERLFRRGANSVCDIFLLYRATDTSGQLSTRLGSILFCLFVLSLF